MVTRVEIIGPKGREFSKRLKNTHYEVSIQDDGRTIKLFEKPAEELIKGVTSCNRTACQAPLIPGQIWENKVMKANYCPECAHLLNTGPFSDKANPLCIIEQSGLEEQIETMFQELKDMHPADGLHSPRDIELTHDINAHAALMDKLQDKLRLTQPGYEIRNK